MTQNDYVEHLDVDVDVELSESWTDVLSEALAGKTVKRIDRMVNAEGEETGIEISFEEDNVGLRVLWHNTDNGERYLIRQKAEKE